MVIPAKHSVNAIIAAFVFLMTTCVDSFALSYQEDPVQQPVDAGVSNSSFEIWTNELPSPWLFVAPNGGEIRRDDTQPHQGTLAALIDATQDSIAGDSFSNLMQNASAVPYRGKNIRLRAAIKTAQLVDASRVQMWLRVDRKPAANQPADAPPPMGAFDNMDDRPIRAETYEYFDIVLPVAYDATNLGFGVFVIGRGQAWIDDVSLAIVDANAKPTAKPPTAQTSEFEIPSKIIEAGQTAELAPQQPFITHWLWLPLVAITLFMLGMLGPMPLDRNLVDKNVPVKTQSLLMAFSVRFAAVYWLLYVFPIILSGFQIVPNIAVGTVFVWYQSLSSGLAHMIAARLFGISEELVPPLGSGDTTYNYMLLLGLFLISVIVASVWTIVDRRATDNANLRDLLRSWLRYGIAFSMIVYGLAKVNFEGNQFPPNSTYQLDKTWGSSSPMNVLWAFMGASQAYTMFAGLGEVIAGLLIVWRRTCLLGAFVALGVMTNVMMLNYCYDVPVKLLSTHLVVMSIMVLMPDFIRLTNLFVLNRAAAPAFLGGAWQSRWAWWTRMAVKTLIVGGLVLLPVGTRAKSLPKQWEKFVESTNKTETQKYPLNQRGFRWINEVPYNR